MKLFIYNFWKGFLDGTDPLSLPFFISLLSRVFECDIEHTTDLKEAEILLESISHTSMINRKLWKYSILFSGESRLCSYSNLFDCILWGRPTQDKIVSLPLFIPYMISSGAKNRIFYMDRKWRHNKIEIPVKKSILAIISNAASPPRNQLLDILDINFHIEYAGKYRTNRPIIEEPYFSQEFWNKVADYRCVLCLENSKDEGYVTEKITHGMAAGTIPIYWGAPNVAKYFNTKRFVHIENLDKNSMQNAIDQISRLMNDDEYYKSIIKEPIFPEGIDGEVILDSHMNCVVESMRHLLLGTKKPVVFGQAI